jgi:hypothetical protein
VCTRALEILREDGGFGDGRDLTDEVDRLHALIDGLAVEHTWDPAARAPERVLALVELHVDSLRGAIA